MTLKQSNADNPASGAKDTMQARLVVSTASGRQHTFPLEREVTVIGRGRQCDLVLENVYASRRHARIEKNSSGHVLVDEDSTNGTFLNGKRVGAPSALSTGDEIGIADLTIVYLIDAGGETTTRTPVRRIARESPIRCDSLTWEVWLGENRLDVRLSLQEFELLSLLASSSGRVLTRDELGKAIWGENNYDYNMLHRLVHRLKRKTEKGRQRFIKSVPGVGYKIEVAEGSG